MSEKIIKPTIAVCFIGHVDAGKSTLNGRILLDLGLVDMRTLEKYKIEAATAGRESWYLSWLTDTSPAERAKGKTQEMCSTKISLPNNNLILNDTPGHKLYVQDMIKGANQSDIALLLVSARKGEFEAGFLRSGQTREHVILSKAGGIETLIVVINKMDEAAYDKSIFSQIVKKIHLFLAKFYKSIIYVPIAGYHGHNVLHLQEKEKFVRAATAPSSSVQDIKEETYRNNATEKKPCNSETNNPPQDEVTTDIHNITDGPVTNDSKDQAQDNYQSKNRDTNENDLNDVFSKISLNSRNITSENLTEILDELENGHFESKEDDRMPWYQGASLLGILNTIKIRRNNQFSKCTVLESGKNFNIVRIESGKIIKQWEFIAFPNKKVGKIVNLYDEEETEMEIGHPGETMKIKTNIDLKEGDILFDLKYLNESKINPLENNTNTQILRVAKIFTCKLTIINIKKVISPGYKCLLHLRMSTRTARIVGLQKRVAGRDDQSLVKIIKIPHATVGDRVRVKIEIDEPVYIQKGDAFALRDENLTIGVGVIRKIIE